MRVECGCGIRTKVTIAQAGRTIQCQCGREIEVPSLRNLKEIAPEKLLADTFSNPAYWSNRGCFLCGHQVGVAPFPLVLELQQAEYKHLPMHIGPVALLGIVIGPLFGLGAALAQSGQKIQTKEPKALSVMVGICSSCAASEDVVGKCLAQLSDEPYGRELFEDYPEMRVCRPNSR